jgi:hypothetical protein
MLFLQFQTFIIFWEAILFTLTSKAVPFPNFSISKEIICRGNYTYAVMHINVFRHLNKYNRKQ